MIATVLSYWWVLVALLPIVMYKFVLRVIFGMVIVPEDRIGLVTKKFVLFGAHKNLPDGRIIATNGEAGYQATALAPGIYWAMWIWQYEIKMEKFIQVPSGQIGLVESNDGAPLPIGNILARKVNCDNFQDATGFLNNRGQKGKQTAILTPGTYRINTYAFAISVTANTVINENKVGIVTVLDGAPIQAGAIAGKDILGHNNFQDIDAFLTNGGNRGLQPQVMLAGTYYLNPWAIKLEQVPMSEVPIGHVGVIISYIGDEGTDVSGDAFKHGNIVGKGFKGVWADPLGPGKYPLNTYTTKIELVPTTNLVLNWASARSESHNLDKHLSTITVRSKDGFPFNLDVSQIIHVPANEAPKVIARFGNMNNLVSQVLEPTIGNYFRNSAQHSDVIEFLSKRTERQKDAKEHIKAVLDEYNVHAVDTLIGDIVPPNELMKTLTDRKIAQEEEKTYETQTMTQEKRQHMEKATAIANMQKDMVKAQQSVEIAERTADAAVKTAQGEATSLKVRVDAESAAVKVKAGADAEATKLTAGAEAERISKIGLAEASKIEAIGKATAESYQLQASAMGSDNFSRLKITEEISAGNIKIIPDIIIGGGNGSEGAMNGLMGMQLLQMVKENKVIPPATAAN